MPSAAYDEALQVLYGLSSRGVELGLDRIRRVLVSRGSPHEKLRYVHVAGTNGKGSVAATTASILRASGLRTGLYTSPHLHRLGERIRVDGRPISDAALVRHVRTLRAAGAFEALTFFEAVTVIAFEHFVATHCDVVVLEVGLGGRFDATNVVVPEVAVLTNVGLDHTAWLGSSLAVIAAEKVAIAKAGRQLVHGVREASARAVVDAYAAELVIEATSIDDGGSMPESGAPMGFASMGYRIEGVPLRLRGEHQRRNLALAVLACFALRRRGFEISDEAIRRGASRVRWPARLEFVRGTPRLLLDGAHNVEGCLALANYLDSIPRSERALVFGAMNDKDLPAMLAAFDGRVDHIVYVAPELSRAERPERLATLREGFIASSVEAGLAEASRRVGASGLVVGAGSLFVVAALRASRLGLSVDPPIAM